MRSEASKGRRFGAALVVAGLLLAVGGWWWLVCPKVVAEVGDARITEQDIGYRIGAEQAYGTTIERPAALVALVNNALESQVGKAAGIEVTERELDEFSAFVDHNSKAPEVLAKVKQAFGEDEATYRRFYLAPKVMNRKLRKWFSRDETMQKESRDAIRRAYALAAAGNDMSKVAKVTGLRFAEQEYSMEKRDAPAALKTYFPAGFAMLTPGFQKLLDGLQPGEMASTIAEDDSSYRVVRLIGKGKGTYRTAEITAAKAPFEAWFARQRKKIRVTILHAGLHEAVAGSYPTLPWRTAE